MERQPRSFRTPGPRWALAVVAAGLPVWTTVAIALDVYGHRDDPGGCWDAIVVAGCPVMRNGQPSQSLFRRTSKAVELWQKGRAPVIVLTGGAGESTPAEAVAAAAVARRMGVPESAMILEDKSRTTLENVRLLRRLVNFNRIVVVTDTYHVMRCEWFFGKCFQMVRGVGVVSPPVLRTRGAIREAVAFAYFIIFPPRI